MNISNLIAPDDERAFLSKFLSPNSMRIASLGVMMAMILSPSMPKAIGQTGGSYALRWNTLSEIGSTSSGGQFVVTGALLPFDRKELTGGTYSLVTGLIFVIQETNAPMLQIQTSGRNFVLSWPNPSEGFRLQETESFTGPTTKWMDVLQPSTPVDTTKRVTLPVVPGNRFFRLPRP